VRTLQHEDRMDSFVLSETLKYLYLLFAKPEELYLGKQRNPSLKIKNKIIKYK
jgi:hypothetical protein